MGVLLFLTLLTLFAGSVTAFELEIEEGVNESLINMILASIPANATAGLSRISFHAESPRWNLDAFHEWYYNEPIFGSYSPSQRSIDAYYVATRFNEPVSLYDLIRHELGHHYDYMHHPTKWEGTTLKRGEAYRNHPAETFANSFQIYPKCGPYRFHRPDGSMESLLPPTEYDRSERSVEIETGFEPLPRPFFSEKEVMP